MAITFIQRKKRQQYLIVAVLTVFLILAFVLWQGFKGDYGGGGLIVQPSKGVELRFDVLSGAVLKNLQNPGAEIVLPADIGKRNPFLP